MRDDEYRGAHALVGRLLAEDVCHRSLVSSSLFLCVLGQPKSRCIFNFVGGGLACNQKKSESSCIRDMPCSMQSSIDLRQIITQQTVLVAATSLYSDYDVAVCLPAVDAFFIDDV